MTTKFTEDQLALLLEAARNFAFGQMARDDRLVPFAAYVTSDGPIDCLRVEDETTQVPFGEIYDATIAAMLEGVASGDVLACALVAAIEGGEDVMGPGFRTALSIHLEAPGFCREVLVPYRVDQGATPGEATLVLGAMAPHPSAWLVFQPEAAA